MGSDDVTVLIVDDEQAIADVYALRLRDRTTTRSSRSASGPTNCRAN
ncbi:MAG: hypothetical protein V5A34_11305 [Halapricum sp.]